MRALSQAFILCIALLLGTTVEAKTESWNTGHADMHPVTPLEWKNPKQTLLYRSCGCADSCWDARLYKRSQIKNNHTSGEPITTLHCDCEKLWAKRPHANEQTLYEESCGRFENPRTKFPLISTEVERLMSTKHATPAHKD